MHKNIYLNLFTIVGDIFFTQINFEQKILVKGLMIIKCLDHSELQKTFFIFWQEDKYLTAR